MIYISGKITGTNDYLQRFEQAEKELISNNYTPLNPAKVNDTLPKVSYEEYIKMSLCMLSLCDSIYMLSGWEDSVGARLEWNYAKANNYKIYYENK